MALPLRRLVNRFLPAFIRKPSPYLLLADLRWRARRGKALV
ncbi:hypothetical protein MycrhDRAFT_3335 [Mycolicibacterium rhodesiae JS60]|nr:hypothetical protein MycrhDRAFT_3335 [Mycolicibacterium rhodesiae JS60]